MSSIDITVPRDGLELYLEQCAGSVLRRNVANLRVLIINHVSPDDTPVVGECPATADAQVSFWRHAGTDESRLPGAVADALVIPGSPRRAIPDFACGEAARHRALRDARQTLEAGKPESQRLDARPVPRSNAVRGAPRWATAGADPATLHALFRETGAVGSVRRLFSLRANRAVVE